MRFLFDLHAHSGYAGGAGTGGDSNTKRKRLLKRFLEASVFSPFKGINLLGTGDCQFLPWLNFLKSNLIEIEPGLFVFDENEGERKRILEIHKLDLDLSEYPPPSYLLQTEVIFTSPIEYRSGRTKCHVLFLFPDFSSVDEFNNLLNNWGVLTQKMARPFITCDNKEQVADYIHEIMSIDSSIEVIPAHVMTPEGVYGGNNGANHLKDFFGDAAESIQTIETGLSADPLILDYIPELRNRTFISNADAHSSALNRIGREFTVIEASRRTYSSIIDAIRSNQVSFTGEFHPTEGRYFLTGHRENRKKPYLHKAGEFCFFSPKYVPEGNICPICNQQLTKGVLQRVYEVGNTQGEDRPIHEVGTKRKYLTMIPLVEVIAYSLGIKSISSRRVFQIYNDILQEVIDEVHLWQEKVLPTSKTIPNEILSNLEQIYKGEFSFYPPGYDGIYGSLRIGETIDWEECVNLSKMDQAKDNN